MGRRSISWLVFAASAAAAVACADFTPVPRATPGSRDSGASVDPGPNDAASGGDGASESSVATSPCHACVESTCGAECRGDARCWQVYECAAKKNCFEGKAQQEIIDCTRPCAVDLGVLASDPEVLKLFFMLDCGNQKCKADCRFP